MPDVRQPNTETLMITIFPAGISALRTRVADLQPDLPVVWDLLSAAAPPYEPGQEAHPFIQLAYDEIAEASVGVLLGYAGIASAGAPIGLPFDFTPILVRDHLFFPLDGLRSHLVATETVRSRLSPPAETDELTAEEYLAFGVLECISYCEERRLGMVLLW
jgi:hypothetical protein